MANLATRDVQREISEVNKQDPEMAFVLGVYCRLAEEEPVEEGEVGSAVGILEGRLGAETYYGRGNSETIALDSYMGSIHQGALIDELTTPGTEPSVLRVLDSLAGGVVAGKGWREYVRARAPGWATRAHASPAIGGYAPQASASVP
jgi:hypothetical protein